MSIASLIANLASVALATPATTADPFHTEVPAPPFTTPALPVTGGDDVEDPLDWPDTAGVVIDGYVGCTGTLIAPDVVITAGHCAEPGHYPSRVILGTNDYRDPGETIDVDSVDVYPNSWYTYDVAVLVLERESSYAPRVIATDCVRDDIRDGATAIVVGYGAIDTAGYRYTPELQWGETVISDADCSNINSGCNDSVSPNGELGAGVQGVDACYGDSGGPLYLPTERGTFLVGVTSRGFYNAECGDGGVWVRPDSPDLFEWIEDVSGRTLPRPACFEPSAPALYAVKNHPGYSLIETNYPEGEPFTFEIVALPANGNAIVNEAGLVMFTPETGFNGEDAVTVRIIADSGGSADLTIPIKMVSRSTYRRETGESVGCGCTTDAGSASALTGLLGLLALSTASRRSRRR